MQTLRSRAMLLGLLALLPCAPAGRALAQPDAAACGPCAEARHRWSVPAALDGPGKAAAGPGPPTAVARRRGGTRAGPANSGPRAPAWPPARPRAARREERKALPPAVSPVC